ncbi:alpha/beta hydrolase [Lapidilactobacillus mulanensis]|uniref:Alpha/beta hydrolase n=1 Tax=Lapidilactobacillus mulanensis TaxID=2485999 RepID=A0ABW4DQI7_9LACO|nr:alpha/beta hydrolase [Lapidilactobacillus mulanensis]
MLKIKSWRWKNHGLLLLALVFLMFLTGSAYYWTRENVDQLAKWRNSRLSPVIMIPGSSATENRFDSLVAKLNETAPVQHSLLKVKVYNSGQIIYSGHIRARDDEPIIVVGFQNNQDGYDNIKLQAKMFDKVFAQLQARYNFNNFKAFGYSNGGLIYTAFLEKYYDQYDVTMKRLMTIGSPYNFNEATLNHKTQMLADFIDQRKKLPTDLTVYSIAGTENYDSDGLVPLGSVEAGKYIYQEQVKHYTEITVTGGDAQHSDLPDNQQIVQLIQTDLLEKIDRNQSSGKVNATP